VPVKLRLTVPVGGQVAWEPSAAPPASSQGSDSAPWTLSPTICTRPRCPFEDAGAFDVLGFDSGWGDSDTG